MIYFHSEKGNVTINGTERHWFGYLCNRMLIAILNPGMDEARRPHPFRKALPVGHYATTSQGSEWTRDIEVMVASGMDSLVIGGHKTDLYRVALNTTLAIGGDALKFAARVHGQCEIHAFVEGHNRTWLADIVKTGLRHKNVFRENVGWEAVVELLRSSNEGPVVMSYSVCEQFPSQTVAENEGLWTRPETEDKDADQDDWSWCDLPDDKKWQLAVKAIRMQEERGYQIELKPENWHTFRFGDGIDAFNVMNYSSSIK